MNFSLSQIFIIVILGVLFFGDINKIKKKFFFNKKKTDKKKGT
jgi:hypothetical protein